MTTTREDPMPPVRRDDVSAAFFDGTASGHLMLLRRTATGELLDPRTDTSDDPDGYERVAAAGTGTIVTWTVPHVRLPGGGEVTQVTGIVQLDEGPWWPACLEGFAADEEFAGCRVRARFVRSGSGGADDEVVPVFVAADPS